MKKCGKYPSRRGFISSCATCGAFLSISPLSVFGSSNYLLGRKKMKIRIIFVLHDLVQPIPDWPNLGFDFKPVMENTITVLRKQFPSFEFVSTSATGREDAEKILGQEENEKIDGYIVYLMNTAIRITDTIAKSRKPILLIDFLYGGTGRFLSSVAMSINEKQSNIGFVSSSRIEDIVASVKCFENIAKGGSVDDFAGATERARIKSTPAPGNLSYNEDVFKTLSADETLHRMKESKILAARNQTSRCADPIMGIPLEYISFAELNYAWETADKHEAEAIAENWQNKATEVTGVRFNILQDSAAMYLGMKSVLKNHNANAITINCLGGFYGNHIHAYPCLGFHELNNEGFIGACECDIRSTATMVAFSIMTQGRPGMISDPVIDTSKRQIIYAHCVAPSKMFGPDGGENPFEIMTHSEDRQGAAVRSILPIGYLTTSLKIDHNRKEIILHQGVTVANDPEDRACRTKLCTEPIGDIEKLFTKWDQWGWHRVTFYGDLKKQVYELADAIQWKVVEEA